MRRVFIKFYFLRVGAICIATKNIYPSPDADIARMPMFRALRLTPSVIKNAGP
jgi:hypothetical protein